MIFIISDLHLSFSTDKPMDIFGDNWTDHTGKIKEDWLKKVGDDDLVVLPGDISWSMRYDEALVDFKWIHELPGTKLIIKGNHDYWWNYKSKLAKEFPSIVFLNSNSYTYGKYVFVGSRGWDIPSEDDAENLKIYNRELVRLENSLKSVPQNRVIIGLTHYPPSPRGQETSVTQLFEKYGVKQVYFGHVHTKQACDRVFKGMINDVKYDLVSCDYIDFKLIHMSDDSNVDIGLDNTDFENSAVILEHRMKGIEKLRAKDDTARNDAFNKADFVEFNYKSLDMVKNAYRYYDCEGDVSSQAETVFEKKTAKIKKELFELGSEEDESLSNFVVYCALAEEMAERPVLSIADGLIKYHFINTLAKKRMLEAEEFEFKDFERFLRMREFAHRLYELKDVVTMGMVESLLEADVSINYYKIQMRSESLDGKMYEISAVPSENIVLHTTDEKLVQFLKKAGVNEKEKQKSIISEYVNKKML